MSLAAGGARPRLEVVDEASGCPGVTGSFVAVFEAERGILVLSGDGFPGGVRVGTASGGPLSAARGGWTPWTVTEVGADPGPSGVWAARYGFRERPVTGCVGFDKQRFSAEGDLASYVSWLVETVYARLPAEVRLRHPALRLGDRVVRLRVSRAGSAPIELEGTEGSTLACRFADGPRMYLAIPYVLDEAEARLAVEVGSSDADYFEAAAKEMLGFVVVEPGAPAAIGELGLDIAALEVRQP